jgi:hypothetical protein
VASKLLNPSELLNLILNLAYDIESIRQKEENMKEIRQKKWGRSPISQKLK